MAKRQQPGLRGRKLYEHLARKAFNQMDGDISEAISRCEEMLLRMREEGNSTMANAYGEAVALLRFSGEIAGRKLRQAEEKTIRRIEARLGRMERHIAPPLETCGTDCALIGGYCGRSGCIWGAPAHQHTSIQSTRSIMVTGAPIKTSVVGHIDGGDQ